MERTASPFADAGERDPDAWLAQAIRRCARRDPAALRELYEQTAPQLMAWLLQMLDDARAAGLALPACYQKAWREAARHAPGICPADVWLRGMARATAIEALRGEQREHPREDMALLLQMIDATAGLSTADNVPAPAARRTLRLAYASGADVPQLAAALDQPVAQVRADLRAGLHAMLPPAGNAPPELREELLAGLFVLGVQSQRVRRRYGARLQRSPADRRRVQQWEARLAWLGADPPPVRPDETQWKLIAGQLQNPGQPQVVRRPSRWLWVAALLLAGAMAWALFGGAR